MPTGLDQKQVADPGSLFISWELLKADLLERLVWSFPSTCLFQNGGWGALEGMIDPCIMDAEQDIVDSQDKSGQDEET